VSEWTLLRGDCRNVLPTLPAASFDLVLTDPPYPEVDRPYGRLTEAEWFDLMRAVVPEVRRVLKPSGSAVFVLQPNSRKVGSMRTWLWDFLAWVGREWNVVQDAYWWNVAAMPGEHSARGRLMRPSLKTCVWCGPPDCYRDQDAVLWGESLEQTRRRLTARAGRVTFPSGHDVDRVTMAAASLRRDGVTPFNVFPAAGVCEEESKQGGKHPAMTPLVLCDWWVRYLVPHDGTVLDPFAGTGTVGVAARKWGYPFVGIEKEPAYADVAGKRLADAQAPLFGPRQARPSPLGSTIEHGT
jgi:DNA modification methylase